MGFFQKQDIGRQRQLQMLKLQKEMQGLRNEMEFVEILAQFWPLPNMNHKMERLENKLQLLSQQYQQYSALKAS